MSMLRSTFIYSKILIRMQGLEIVLHKHSIMDILFFLYLLLVFLTLYFLSNHFLHKIQNLPPTPFPCLPIIGHLYLLKSPFHKALTQVSKRYGPVVSLRLGSRPILLVSSPSLIDECLRKNDIVFANRPRFLFAKYFGYNYTSLAWSSYGEHYKNLRKMAVLELLSSQNIQMLAHVRVEEIHKLIFKLYDGYLENPNKIWDVKAILFELTYNIMTRMIMGRVYYGDKVSSLEDANLFQQIVKDCASMGEKANLLDFLPLMRFFGLQNVEPKLKEIQKKRDEFMQRLIEEYRRTKNNDAKGNKKGKSTIEVLLDLHEREPEYYNDELIRSLILVLLQAGSDTSAITLERAFQHLLCNPSILEQAQSDIDNLMLGQDYHLVNEADISKLPLFRNILTETLRLDSPAPLLVPHRSSKECNVGGYRVPKDTILLVNAWGMHHDPSVWEDPGKFKPERFQDYFDKLQGGNKFLDGSKFAAFGSGRRACPGECVAYRIMGLALGSLIQCFDWEKIGYDDGVGIKMDVNKTDNNVAAPKVQPFMARCYPRQNTKKLISHIKIDY